MFLFKINQNLWTRELIGCIMSCDNSLGSKDMYKFILLFHDSI
jgi:hypothetical protein